MIAIKVDHWFCIIEYLFQFKRAKYFVLIKNYSAVRYFKQIIFLPILIKSINVKMKKTKCSIDNSYLLFVLQHPQFIS